jgi:hypothetical protein
MSHRSSFRFALALIAAGAVLPGCGAPKDVIDLLNDGEGRTAAPWHVTGRMVDTAYAGANVLALNTAGEVVRGVVRADGALDMDLAAGTWSVSFVQADRFLGTLYFQEDAAGRSSSRLRLPERFVEAGASAARSAPGDSGVAGDVAGGEVELGEITIADGVASAEHNPNEAIDTDGDGVVNFEDDDADGSGVADADEHEVEDSYDYDASDVGVLMVTRIDPGAGHARADVDEEIEVRFNAPITEETAALIHIVDEAGATVPVTLEIDHEGREVKLVPVDLLVAGDRYTTVVPAEVASSDGLTLGTELLVSFRVRSEEHDGDDDGGDDGGDDGDDAEDHDTGERAEGHDTGDRSEGHDTGDRSEGHDSGERSDDDDTGERSEDHDSGDHAEDHDSGAH